MNTLVEHGIGGGTFINLVKKMTREHEFINVVESIKKGNINNINLTIQDITEKETEKLLKEITVSNFGKLDEFSKKEDIILGILNMIAETIGMMAAFKVQDLEYKDVILIGNIMTLPKIFEYFKRIELIQNVNFIVPKNPEYATVIGAIKYGCTRI